MTTTLLGALETKRLLELQRHFLFMILVILGNSALKET